MTRILTNRQNKRQYLNNSTTRWHNQLPSNIQEWNRTSYHRFFVHDIYLDRSAKQTATSTSTPEYISYTTDRTTLLKNSTTRRQHHQLLSNIQEWKWYLIKPILLHIYLLLDCCFFKLSWGNLVFNLSEGEVCPRPHLRHCLSYSTSRPASLIYLRQG